MRQHDIVRNNDRGTQKLIPYFIILQADILQPLATVIVAPLRPAPSPVEIGRLNPTLKINGHKYYIEMQSMAAVPAKRMGTVELNANEIRDECTAAIDLIFTGI